MMVDSYSPFGTYAVSFWRRFFWARLHSKKVPKSLREFFLQKFYNKFNGIFDVRCDDINYRVYPAQQSGDRRIMKYGKLESSFYQEQNFLQQYLFPKMTLVDIGANVGRYSLFVARQCEMRGGGVNLVAFEPNKQTYEKLLFNLRINNVASENVLNCALGDTRGEMDLWLHESNAGQDSLVVNNSGKKQKVQVFPLLDICQTKNIKKIDLLKIDVEGYEDKVLAPFFKTAPASLLPKVIMIEKCHEHLWQENLLALFSKNGYNKVFSNFENEIFVHSSCVMENK